MPDPDLEIRGGGGSSIPLDKGGRWSPPPPKFFYPWGSFWSKNKGGPAPRVLPMDPPLYHDIRFTVVGIDPGLVVHGVGQVSMQIRGTSKARKAEDLAKG